MKTIEQLIKENNINAEAALGRGKTSSGVLGSWKNDSNPLGLSAAQLALINSLVGEKPVSLPPVK